MIFTPEEIQRIFDIVDYRLARIVGDVLGKEFLTPDDKDLLKRNGFDIDQELLKIPPFYQAYLFGRVSGMLKPTQIKTLDYKDLTSYIERKQYKRLSEREKAEYRAAATRTYSYIKGMGHRFKETIANATAEEEIKNTVEYRQLDRGIKEGVLKRRSVQAITNTIAGRLQDWNRDWGRIVETEMQNIYSLGKAQVIMEKHGTDALVYKQVFPQACTHCRHLYTTGGIGSKPRIFKLSQLIANGDNIGRKAKDWKPVVATTHPFCYSADTEVLTKEGFKLFSVLNGNEEFLSINTETGEGEYVKAVKYIAVQYKGQMIERTSRDFNLCTTPNHYHVGLSQYESQKGKIACLRKESDLPASFKFLTHIPLWKGKSPEVFVFDNKKYDAKLFCEFMGYYLSEGSITFYKDKFQRINISQCKKEGRKKIFDCCQKLFKCSLQKERIEVYLSRKDIELINLFSSVKGAFEKFIPGFVKECSPEYLSIFLDAFCLGDGSIHKGTVFDGYQCKPQRIFSTSSIQLASDIGELLLKIGKRPSYRNKGKSIYHCKKQKKDYLAKHDQWEINDLSVKFNLRSHMEETLIEYNDLVYDVELERNHTLVVRRKGKVCVSGNCRCELIYIPKGYVWDQGLESFIPPKDYKQLVERKSKIKINIGDKTFEV